MYTTPLSERQILHHKNKRIMPIFEWRGTYNYCNLMCLCQLNTLLHNYDEAGHQRKL